MIKYLVHEKGKNFVKITFKKKRKKSSFITQDKNIDVITTLGYFFWHCLLQPVQDALDKFF